MDRFVSAAGMVCFASLAGIALGQVPKAALVNPVAPVGGQVAGAPAAAPVAGQAGFKSLDQVLDALDQRGQSLQSFTAEISLTEKDEDTQVFTTSSGKALYDRKPDGKTRIRVSLVEKMDGKAKRLDPVEYVLDGGWLLERQVVKRIQVRRQLFKPGQDVNLFRLGDGAFPMPIGQKKEDVRKQFEASLEKIEPDEKLTGDEKFPPGIAHISLKPRKNTELARQFSLIDVFVDPATNMPIRIDTLDTKGSKSKSTILKKIVVNSPLKDQDFALPPIENQAQWQLRPDEPLKQ